MNPAHLLFGQAHAGTPYMSRVPVPETPHSAALNSDYHAYLDYLTDSWTYYGLDTSEKARMDRLEKFLALRDDIKKNGIRTPVQLVETMEGEDLIVDGNHRAAIAHHLGIDLPYEHVDPQKWLAKILTNKREFYGSKHKGKPYQSVFDVLGNEIVEGRRRDIFRRHEALELEGKVLDLGCNIGAASYLASENGHEVLGVDYSPRLVTSAIRLRAYLSPVIGDCLGGSAQFRVANLSEEVITGYDTIFCFAVAAHLDDLKALRETLSSARIVYFEENDGNPQFDNLRDLFKSVEKIDAGDRPLWRCEP